MHAKIIVIEIRIPQSQSLKDKRSVVQSIVRKLDQIHAVGAAEVGHLDNIKLSTIGAACISSSVKHVETLAKSIEDMIWSYPQIEVLQTDFQWVESI